MKVISALALATLATSSHFIAAAAASDSIPKTLSLLRGSATSEEPKIASSASASSSARRLQRPDETCYALGYPSGNIDTIPCTQDVLNNCNNVPACAAYQNDAVNFGSDFCSIWTVWNNEEPTCQWQYMCC